MRERAPHRSSTGSLRVGWLLTITFGIALASHASSARADSEPGEEAEVSAPGVVGSWEAGLRASYQRLSGAVISSQVTVGSFLGYYLLSSVEPFVGLSLDFQDARVDGGGSATAVNLSFGAGARASFELAERVRPYLALSPGLLLRTTEIDRFDAEDQLDFVLSVQAGVQVVLVPRVALDVGFAYDRIFSDEGEDLYSVPIGLSFFF